MIYRLFIAPAIGFVLFTSMSDAYFKLRYDSCNVSCAVPNNRTKRICHIECELETLEMEENLALKHNETMCVENCQTDPEDVTDCKEQCLEVLTTCEQGCSAARKIATMINKKEADDAFYNCTEKLRPMPTTNFTTPLPRTNFETSLPTPNFTTHLPATNFSMF